MTTKANLMGQWNPLLAQLEGATEAGSSVSPLVLQSMVAQSAKVISRMADEIDRLQSELATTVGTLTKFEAATDRLEAELAEARIKIAGHEAFERSICESLNSGDGSYRP